MLEKELEDYKESQVYPFHMPGHKRRSLGLGDPYKIDLTEIEGFDNLHDPAGVIACDEEQLATLYGSSRSYFLVNGSTAGNLAAIYAAVGDKDTILIARNSHKSIFHGAMLRRLKVEYLYPCIDEIHGFAGMITPKEVQLRLRQFPETKAVVITSPTYEGIVSDLPAIVEIAHAQGIAVIVDAAHGAHLGFHSMFPPSPVQSGADLVVMSLHKTLPSLTQTAALHVNGSLIDRQRLRRALQMFQTSSPSYVLMASVSKCISFLKEQGEEAFIAYAQRLEEFYRRMQDLQNVEVLRLTHQDPSKIVISTAHTGISGEALMKLLRERYGLEPEMASYNYVIAMTSVMDTDEGFLRLERALRELDGEIENQQQRKKAVDFAHAGGLRCLFRPAQKVMEAWQAAQLTAHAVLAGEAAGEVAGEDILLYPPGIPVIVAGERIDGEKLELLQQGEAMGLTVQGWSAEGAGAAARIAVIDHGGKSC